MPTSLKARRTVDNISELLLDCLFVDRILVDCNMEDYELGLSNLHAHISLFSASKFKETESVTRSAAVITNKGLLNG